MGAGHAPQKAKTPCQFAAIGLIRHVNVAGVEQVCECVHRPKSVVLTVDDALKDVLSQERATGSRRIGERRKMCAQPQEGRVHHGQSTSVALHVI